MSWHPEALGGPVLAWEIKRATRRTLWRCLPIAYCGWLVLQALAFLWAVSGFWSRNEPNSRLELYPAIYTQQIDLLDGYVALVLQFQLWLVLAIIPVLVAGSLGQEKERGTLFALFGTELTSRQILLGKLLGRLILIVPVVLTTLPLLVFITTLTGQGLTPVILALAQQLIVAFALGSASLLFGIWIRRAADAIIAAYLFLGGAYVLIRGFSAARPEAFWFDPVDNLRNLLDEGTWLTFLAHLAVWAALGALCLRVGWGRLRKVCVEQRDRKPSRRLWAFRPAVGNNPIRWRECYVIGLAPLPVLRIVPRWLALLAVFAFSSGVAVLIAHNLAPGSMAALAKLDLARAFADLGARKGALNDCVPYLGLVFILLTNLLIGVRCGTSVAEEKRRNTWDDLLLTAQSFREITSGKMWGVLQAVLPYILAYAIPVFVLASLGGPGTLLLAGMWIIVPCVAVYGAALMGIDMIRVPADMDETQEGRAFWFENERADRRRYYAPALKRSPVLAIESGLMKPTLLASSGMALILVIALAGWAQSPEKSAFPDGWRPAAPRPEIQPAITFAARGGPNQAGAFVFATDDGVGQQGWVQKTFPVTGGKTYRFLAQRKTMHVESPRRSTPARIVWQDEKGKLVPADEPAGREKTGRPVPTAEPEHPLDGDTDEQGWTTLTDRYRAPAKATRAVVELHLQWAPKAQAHWSVAAFDETAPVSPRKVRLATIHHRPSGKTPQANCEQFAPLIAEAAEQGANLVVLGETVHYVGVGKKPHEVAEPIPGPSTEYFCGLAKKHGLYIVVSLYERDGRVVYNVALLIGPDGRVIGKYRKVCLPHSEVEAGVMPGSDYPVFETKLGKVGMMVCYDGFYPEVARELTKRGAEVIAWPVWGCDPLLARARACENRVFVVSSTYTDARANWMLSAIYDREGTPIAAADKWGSVAIAEVDLNQRMIGPYNLGDFHNMVQRHRPLPLAESASREPGRPSVNLKLPAR